MKIEIGDKVKFVKVLSKNKTKVPLGEIGIVTDIDENVLEDGLNILVTYRYKQTEYDYEWFMEDELSVVTDELENWNGCKY